MDDLFPFRDPLAFCLLILAACPTPGPTTLLVLVSGLQLGFARSLWHVAIASLGLACVFGASATALGLVVTYGYQLLPAMHIVAALYLCWLAWRIATTPLTPDAGGQAPVDGADLFVVTLSNPKAWMFLSSMQISLMTSSPTLAQTLVGTAAFAAVATPCLLVWSVCGAQLRRLVRTRAAARAASRVLGGAILVSVVMLFPGVPS